MNHWDKTNSIHGYDHEESISLIENAQIIAVVKRGDKIVFREECDGWFDLEMTKEDALEAIEELKQWINSDNLCNICGKEIPNTLCSKCGNLK